MENFNYRDELKQRTKLFVLRIITLYQSLPETTEAQIIGKQLLLKNLYHENEELLKIMVVSRKNSAKK